MTRRAPRARWLLIAVLLALASTLVPALFPAGAVMARTDGSAFDPTTGTVTLRVRQNGPAADTVAIPHSRADAGAGSSDAMSPANAPRPRAAPPLAYPAGGISVDATVWAAPAPVLPARARAPPLER